MTWLHAVLFGVVEGLTEFLPVSSTGHLILTAKLLGLAETDFLKSFQICIQLGAIMAVVLVYGRTLLKNLAVSSRVLIALVPTLIVGFLLYKTVRKMFSNPSTILWGLLLGGIALIIFDLWRRENPNAAESTADIPYQKCFWIGAAQSLAIVPGVSRSGATILGGLALGLKRKTVVEFSFLLGAPTILAATALDLLKHGTVFTGSEWKLLILGALVSCVVALGVIRFFIRYVQKGGLLFFGLYRIAVATFFWMIMK